MRTDTIHARRLPLIATTAAAALGACAGADFIGWMTTKRVVPGGYLINVFAATNNSADNIISLSGGTVGFPSAGFVRTNSAGGFLQGVGTQSVFAPTPARAGQRSTAS